MSQLNFLRLIWAWFFLFPAILPAYSTPEIDTQFPGPTGITATVNNECSGALALTFGVPLNDNNTGATQSLPPNSCNGFASPNANDVWYTFTYTAQMDCVVVVPGLNPLNDIVVELFSGTCGSLNFIGCSNSAEQNSIFQTEGIYLSSLGLTVGESYKLRVYGFNNVQASYYVLLKGGSDPPAPSNDECASPRVLNTGGITVGTSLGATQSLAPISCQGNTSSQAKDVWFRFTKSSTMDSLVLNPSSPIDYVVEIRSNSCAGGTSVSCTDQTGNGRVESLSLSSLTNGTIYLVRVYGQNGSAGEFTLRIRSQLVNNECSGAREILPNGTQVTGTSVDATQSLAPSSCLGASDDDVWFKFVMVPGLDTLRVVPAGLFDPVVELRSGACANTSPVRCVNGGSSLFTEKLYVGNLSPGNTYFIRIYSFNNGQGWAGAFQVSIDEPTPTPPANDECTTPVVITANTVVNGSNANATESAAAVPCGGATSLIVRDVWYRFTKTNEIDSVKADGLGTLDLVVDIRTNSCPNGTAVFCMDMPGTGVKIRDLSNLTNGTTYLLRVYGRDGATGDFLLEFRDAVIVVNPPPNDECFDAVALSVGSTCSGTAGTNVGATETLAPSSACSGQNPGQALDVWYSFTANSNRAIVKLTNSTGFDGAIQVFSGSCFGLNAVACTDKYPASGDPDFPSVEEVFLQGLTSGQQYYFRVYGKNGSEGTFAVCVYDPNCNSTPAVITTASGNILSNQAVVANITSGSGEMVYEYSSNQSFWTAIPSLTGIADTLRFVSTVSGPLFLRLSSRTGDCYPAYSNVVEMAIRCATPFALSPSGPDRINRVVFASLDQPSAGNPMGGNVQDFSQVSTSVCRSNTYSLAITVNNSTKAYNRKAWIDFNQDGDFSDPGENVVSGPYVAGGTLTYPVTIPANAPFGSCRMRIALITNGSDVTSSDPCTEGPFLNGEIEEYTLVVTSGLLANAGNNQSVCGSTAVLNGNDPGAGGTGLWTRVSGSGTILNPGSFSTTVSGLGSGANVFRWTLTNACGTSQSEVTITSTGTSANAGPDQEVCAPNATLAGNAPGSGSSGTWAVLSGGASVTQSGQANSGVTGLGVGANLFVWTITRTGCPESKDTVRIFRKSAPVVSLGNDLALCSTSATLSAPVPSSGSGVWTRISGTGNLATPQQPVSGVSGLGFGPNVFRWTVTDAPCAPVSDDIQVTNNLPGKPSAGLDQFVCLDTGLLNATNLPTGLSGIWTRISGAGTIAAPGSGSSQVVNLGVGPNLFAYTIQVPSCSTQVSDTVVLNREGNPVNLGPDTGYCPGFEPPVTLTGPPGMTEYVWSSGATTQQLVVETNLAGQIVLRVRTPSGCIFRDTVQVGLTICDAVSPELNKRIRTTVVPNPGSEDSRLFVDVPWVQTVRIVLLDMKGTRIMDGPTRLTEGEHWMPLPSVKSSGIYQIRLEGEGWSRQLRWIVP